jgi:hypothetical protein
MKIQRVYGYGRVCCLLLLSSSLGALNIEFFVITTTSVFNCYHVLDVDVRDDHHRIRFFMTQNIVSFVRVNFRDWRDNCESYLRTDSNQHKQTSRSHSLPRTANAVIHRSRAVEASSPFSTATPLLTSAISRSLPSRPAAQLPAMVAQVETMSVPNGILSASKVNGKPIKSKNQLRRLKQKLKKEGDRESVRSYPWLRAC